MAILDEIRNHLLRGQQVRDDADGGTDARRFQRRSELLGSIGLMLEQHEEGLLQQVEADLRDKALAAVKQESESLRRQVYERILAADSELQRLVDKILADAREQMFKRVGMEMSAILEGMDTRLLNALGVQPPAPVLTLPEPCQVEGNAAVAAPAPEPEPVKQETEANAELDRLYQHEVCIVIAPPLKLPALLEFFRCLWQMHNLNAVQTCGSVDKGIILDIRLSEPKALQQVMKSIPIVESVRDTSAQGFEGRRTINIALKHANEAAAIYEQA